MKRKKFRKINQSPGQSAAGFAVLVKRSAARCKFSSSDEACIDQFINEILCEKTRFEIFKEKTLTDSNE